jgi:Rieske Fe-S protein
MSGGILLDVWRSAGKFSTHHWQNVADIEQLGLFTAIPFPEQRIALIMKQERIAALSLECTHLGCLVNMVDQGFFCPCHGSEFGPQGEVWSGPAPTSLPWHPVRIQRNRILVKSGIKLLEPAWVKRTGPGSLQRMNHG